MDVKELLCGSLRRLSYVERYATYYVHRRESVAEHTAFVTIYSMFIARAVEERGCLVDWKKLMTASIVHDFDEAFTGDIIRPVKHKTPGLKTALDAASLNVLTQLEKDTGVDNLCSTWFNAKDGSVEGWILRIADLFDAVSFVINEYYAGNTHFTSVLFELCEYVQGLIDDIRHTDFNDLLSEILITTLNLLVEVRDDASTKLHVRTRRFSF